MPAYPINIYPLTGKDRRLTIAAALRRVGVPQYEDGVEALHTSLHKGHIYLPDYALIPGVVKTLEEHGVTLKQRDETTGHLLPGTPVWGPFGLGTVILPRKPPYTLYTPQEPHYVEFTEENIGVTIFLSADEYDRHTWPGAQAPVGTTPQPTRYILFDRITTKRTLNAILAQCPDTTWPFKGSIRDYLKRGILPCPEDHVPAVTNLLKQFAHPVTDVR